MDKSELQRRFPLGHALVLEELGESSPLARRIHASFKAYLAQAAAYASHSEGGFLSLRSP